MSNSIQTKYMAKMQNPLMKRHEMKQNKIQGNNFLDLATQSGNGIKDLLEINSTEPTQQETELSEVEEMQLFKQEFYQDLSKIIGHPTVSNMALNISDVAFQAMKDDPEYKSEVLSLIQRDLGASYAPRNCSVLITVGANLDQYRADSWPVGNDSEFRLRSKDSFYSRTSESKERQKELLEEYQEKKLQAKQRKQKLLEQAAQDRYHLAQMGIQEKSFSAITDLMKARIEIIPSTIPEVSSSIKTDKFSL